MLARYDPAQDRRYLAGDEEADNDADLQEEQPAYRCLDDRPVKTEKPPLDAASRMRLGNRRDDQGGRGQSEFLENGRHVALNQVRRRQAGQVISLAYPRPGRHSQKGRCRARKCPTETFERTAHDEHSTTTGPTGPT